MKQGVKLAEATTQTLSMSASNRILRLIDGLSATPTGQKVYGHIRRNLEQLELGRVETEQAYMDLLGLMLDVATQALPNTSEQSIELQLLRLSLVPGISTQELKSLEEQVKSITDNQESEEQKLDFLEQAIKPLLLAQNNVQALSPAPSSATSSTNHDKDGEPSPNHNTPKEAVNTKQVHAITQVDLIYQTHLDKTRDSMHTIQHQLGEEIVSSMQINDELATLLTDTIQTLTDVDAIASSNGIASSHVKRCQELLNSHKQLVAQLDQTYNKLHTIESTGHKFDEELSHLHRLSLTDELTELPNRRAILQRMEDEVARSKRYDTPLALAIIDLDKFKQINDQYGHATGDTILQCFAQKMLAIFRHHDTAARYGGEEFAVLMPNTDIDGAFKALEKIRYVVRESTCTLDNGEEIPMPSFSAGVALYTPDESPEELLNRADMAMYRAKQMGRSRIEVHSTISAHKTNNHIQKKPS